MLGRRRSAAIRDPLDFWPQNPKIQGDHTMKTTYLVYKQVDGVRQLVAATQEEWDAIMKENRGLPR